MDILKDALIQRHLVLVALLNAGPRSDLSQTALANELWSVRKILSERYGYDVPLHEPTLDLERRVEKLERDSHFHTTLRGGRL